MVSISRTTQTSINYRPATDGLSRIVEARFGTWDKMNTDCLHLQEIPLPDIPRPSRHHKQKHPNDCSELRHRCCRRNCRNVPIYKADGKDWQLCLRKKRRYPSNSSSLSSCLLYCSIIPWTWWKLRFSFNRLHFWSRIMVWVCGHDTCKFRRAEKAFSVLLSRSFMLYYKKNPQSLTFLLHISHNPLVSPAHSSPPFWGLTQSKR